MLYYTKHNDSDSPKDRNGKFSLFPGTEFNICGSEHHAL